MVILRGERQVCPGDEWVRLPRTVWPERALPDDARQLPETLLE